MHIAHNIIHVYIHVCTLRHLEWHNLEAVVGEDNVIQVKDVMTEAEERLGQNLNS